MRLQIMADGTKRALSSGRQQRRAPWGSGAARGLLQDGANIMPEQEALPGHLVSAIKVYSSLLPCTWKLSNCGSPRSL